MSQSFTQQLKELDFSSATCSLICSKSIKPDLSQFNNPHTVKLSRDSKTNRLLFLLLKEARIPSDASRSFTKI